MKNRAQVSLYAASAARRASLQDMITNALPGDAIKLATRLDPSRGFSGIFIADLATHAEATAFLELLEHAPGTRKSIALIDSPDPQWVRTALAAGTNAILSRQADPDELDLALSAAESDLILLHRNSTEAFSAGSLGKVDPLSEAGTELEELTAREQEVLRLLADGLGNKQIAARLNISEHTAKFHISSILGKMSAGSRTEAVSQGIRRGLIPI
ncbi:MAG TPA: response regulator transcription factor [Candidatus Angelobacter sp.]|nr:response regulator transcription factor [Candidatus Angelobacter sp.]